MSRPPDTYKISEALSEVMDDIGVNERLVMKRRRSALLQECIQTIFPEDHLDPCQNGKFYILGSKSEGSTTLGLVSDMDILYDHNKANVIQSMSEWKHGVRNLMMIQHENISPGYCYLQQFVYGLPSTLLENTAMFSSFNEELSVRNGPAITEPKGDVYNAIDKVPAHSCASLPHQATSWLQKQRHGKWPTEDILDKCRNAGCFVVPVGSKVHSPDILESKLEWRISTSLQERYLMFSLNINQLRCYILMKMIVKTHINPRAEDVLSSFMCKNVLLFCVCNSPHGWHTGNLLAYLHLCLFMLKECVKQRNCPHFIIRENNLLAGHMTDTQRSKLLDIIINLIENDEELLYRIQIDALGRRLKMKLNQRTDCSNIQCPTHISNRISFYLVQGVSAELNNYLRIVLLKIKHERLEITHQSLSKLLSNLRMYRREPILFPHIDIGILHTTCDLIIPLVSSTLGSVLACMDIDNQRPISELALAYLEAGKASDALSGRLKFVSVLYCTGDMEGAEHELKDIETQHQIEDFHTVCECCTASMTKLYLDPTCLYNIECYNEKAIKSNIALCTRFLQCEMNCVPHELRYEILRSYIEEDRLMRTAEDSMWMDSIIVDSIPYLFFFLHKTLGNLQRIYLEHPALLILAQIITNERYLGHKETALNLLGQCCEQKNWQPVALQCFIMSLKHRRRNNAAKFLLCIQLSKLWKRDNRQ